MLSVYYHNQYMVVMIVTILKNRTTPLLGCLQNTIINT